MSEKLILPISRQQRRALQRQENNVPISLDVHDLHGKTVIIRVKDPVAYQANCSWTTSFLKGAGAASVIICKEDDKIDVLSDDELAELGLKRI